MKVVSGDNFCELSKYKLYRTVYDVLHPTISKKNISNYKVVFEEKLLPTLIFYPKRVSNIKSVIIMVPGNGVVNNSYGKYSNICKRMAIETEKLVIAIDYFNGKIKYPTTVNKVYKVISYLCEELEKNGINSSSITLMSDSTGCGILNHCLYKLKKKDKKIGKMIMFYPVGRNDYTDFTWDENYLNVNFNLDKKINNYLKKYYVNDSHEVCNLLESEKFDGFPNTLIVTGDMDIFKEDGIIISERLGTEYKNIMFASHGFLGCEDEEILSEAYKIISDFVNR